MQHSIHPKYTTAVVTCACGATFTTRSTKSVITVEICSQCHPFYTGKQKLVDTAGRIEKFQRRYKSHSQSNAKKTSSAASTTPKNTEKSQTADKPPVSVKHNT